MGGSVLVIRQWSEEDEPGLLHAELAAGATLFLHGDGVVLAEPGRLPELPGASRLEVCAASWRRRYTHAPDPRFRSSSLILMYQALDRAERYRVLGRGGISTWCSATGPAPGWLLEITSPPADARDRAETLEFVLGAAAFGLDARVLIRRPGYNHLLTDTARGWAQLSDFDLLELICELPAERVLEVPVRRVDADAVAALDAVALRRLVL